MSTLPKEIISEILKYFTNSNGMNNHRETIRKKEKEKMQDKKAMKTDPDY